MARYSPPVVQYNTIRLAEVLAALSLATDLGAGRSMGHAMRACILGMRMGSELRLSEQEQAVYRQLPMWKERIKIVPTILREMVIDQTYRFNAKKFADLQVPTMLLLGGDSSSIFRQPVEMLASELPNSRVVIMPGQQHIAMDTNPELFVREVMQFLQPEFAA